MTDSRPTLLAIDDEPGMPALARAFHQVGPRARLPSAKRGADRARLEKVETHPEAEALPRGQGD